MKFLIAALLACSTAVQAQSFPSRPLRLVLPYQPGGITDLVARTLAQKLNESTGQPVVVDNRPGGNFIIGAEFVAKSAPDGYTLFLAPDSTFTLNPITLSNLPYDVERDFAPISRIGLATLFMVASAKAPGKTFEALLRYA